MNKKEQIKVDKEFLMKMTNQIDNLTKQLEEMKNRPVPAIVKEIPKEIPTLDYKVSFYSADPNKIDISELNLTFKKEIENLMNKYKVVKFVMDYKK